MEENGYLPIGRSIFANPLWTQEREFSDFEAWFDMIGTARFGKSEVEVVIRGVGVLKLQRGELVGSVRYLAKRWNWGEKKVRVFLKRLTAMKMIETHQRAHVGAQSITVIKLLNYETYNDVDNYKVTPKGTPLGTRRAHEGHKEEEGKEGKKVLRTTTTVPAVEELKLSSKSEPYQTVEADLIKLWNLQGVFRKCANFSEGRRKTLRARLKEVWWRENWQKGVSIAAQSDFCLGTNSRNWVANIEWFLRPETLTNILEGKYGENTKNEYENGKF